MLFLPDPSSAFADQARPAIQPVRGGFAPRDQGWPDRLAGWSPARNHGPPIPPAPVAPHRPESADRRRPDRIILGEVRGVEAVERRSEEHTSELQSLMRISYAGFCLKKKKNNKNRSDKSD